MEGSEKGCHSSLGQETFGFSFPKNVIILKDIQGVLRLEIMLKKHSVSKRYSQRRRQRKMQGEQMNRLHKKSREVHLFSWF